MTDPETRETSPPPEEIITLRASEFQEMLDQQRADVVAEIRAEQRKVFTPRFVGRLGLSMGGAFICIAVALYGGNEVLEARTKGVTNDIRAIRTEAENLGELVEGEDIDLGAIQEGIASIDRSATALGDSLGLDTDPEREPTGPCIDEFMPTTLGTERWCADEG